MIKRFYFMSTKCARPGGYSFSYGLIDYTSWLPRHNFVLDESTKKHKFDYEAKGLDSNDMEIISFSRI